jgi:predicted O-linked N-acetylglucosamine transferase (SPINDLY family)
MSDLELNNEKFELGLSFHQQGNPDQAEMIYREVLNGDPNHKHAWSNLGAILSKKNKLEEAINCYRKALEIDQQFGECWFNLGNALRKGMNPAGAEAAFLQALKVNNTLFGAAVGLGQALSEQGKFPQAVDVFKQIIAQKQDDPDLYSHLGNALRMLGLRDEAMQAYQMMLNLKPNDPKIIHQYGLVMMDVGRLEEAFNQFKYVLSIKQDYPEAHNSMSIVLQMLKQDDNALAHNLEAVRLNPNFTEAWNNLGNLYGLGGKPKEAIDAFRKSIALQPRAIPFHSNLLLNLHYSPDMTGEEVYKEHTAWAEAHLKNFPPAQPFDNNKEGDRKLRLGIVSPDFRKHTVNAFMEPFLDSLDRNKFEVFAYSSVIRPDEKTEQFKLKVDHFIDIRPIPDMHVSSMLRKDQIDVLLDLAGHTAGSRLPIFALKSAPIQITQFGYPNTTGIPGFGFRITDAFADPKGLTEANHSEELVRLPGLAWCYQPPADAPEVPKRSPKAGAIIFGSLNNMAKHNGKVLSLWAKLLSAVPGSKLRLLSGPGQESVKMVRHAMQTAGVNPDRVEFLSRMEKKEYFAALGEIDIALDPFPYNGGITSCDTLWMGTPLLTLAGKTYVSRQGVSILSNVGMEDWIAKTPEEFIEKAKKFASEATRLSLLRGKLRDMVKKSSICDWKAYGSKWEETVRKLWKSWCASK